MPFGSDYPLIAPDRWLKDCKAGGVQARGARASFWGCAPSAHSILRASGERRHGASRWSRPAEVLDPTPGLLPTAAAGPASGASARHCW